MQDTSSEMLGCQHTNSSGCEGESLCPVKSVSGRGVLLSQVVKVHQDFSLFLETLNSPWFPDVFQLLEQHLRCFSCFCCSNSDCCQVSSPLNFDGSSSLHLRRVKTESLVEDFISFKPCSLIGHSQTSSLCCKVVFV